VPVVGVVPPIKPAATLTKSGAIGLLATPATVQRAYTNGLIAQFAADKTVVRFGSSALVEAAEQKLRGETTSGAAITEDIEGLFGAPGGADIDVVALACTHFPLMVEELAAAAPGHVTWLDSGAAIARRVANVLIADAGQAHVNRAAFTDAESARRLFPAFHKRAFKGMAAIGAAPEFRITDMHA